MDGLVNLLVLLALMYLLIKIPFWILGSLRLSSGRSLIGGLARAYVTGQVMGAVAGRSGRPAPGRGPGRGAGSRGGQAGAARTGLARTTARSRGAGVGDPPWPAPLREWGGLDGLYSPDALGRRLRAQQAAERDRTGTRSGVEQPRFLQPTPQVPTHDLATGHAPSAPTAAQFHAANGTVSTPSGQPVAPPRPWQRSRPPRRYPPFSTPGAPTARRPVPAPPPPLRTPSVPPELRFQPALPPPASTPLHAAGPPEAVVFHPPTPDRGATGRRARADSPAPVQFIAPRPATPPPPPRTHPTGQGGDPT